MKKMVMTAVFAAFVSMVFAENVQDDILGYWSAESFIIEQEDGMLVAVEAAYSHPYLGITGINFIDSSFVVFTVLDVEYRAFYEIENFDFDNYNISCRFKDGEEFLLKIVRIPKDGWKYLYRVAEGSVLTGVPVEEDIKVSQDSEDIYSTYIGTMKRQ